MPEPQPNAQAQAVQSATPANTTQAANKFSFNFDLAEILPGVILAAALAMAMMLGSYFFAASKITMAMFLTINVFPLVNAILTMNFLSFLIAASFSLAIILLIGRKYPFKLATGFCTAGYLAGALISLALFNLWEYSTPLVIGVIGIPLGIRYLLKKEEELKYLKGMRSGASAAGRIVTFVCIIFAISLLITTLPEKDKLSNEFVPQMLGMTVGNGVALSDSFTGQLAGAIATQQQQTVGLIMSQQEMANLQEKKDPDGLALAAKLADLNAQFAGSNFKDTVTKNLKNQNVDIGKELLTKFPMMQFLASIAWILYPLSALITLLFVGSTVLRNLAGCIYGAISRFLS